MPANMKMKKPGRILALIILAAVVCSLIPALWLYVKRSPSPYTNEQAIEKLKDNKGEYFAFVVLGDNHSGLIFNDSATLKLIRHINREDRFKKIPIDFVGISGDVTCRGTGWDYRIYNKVRALIKRPVISAIGNHDEDNNGRGLFGKYAGKNEFAFADRDSYFIVVDNTEGDISDEQFSRLEKELETSSHYAHRFVFVHKSPLSPYQQSWYRPELNPWSYRFMKLCEKYKVDIVFAGHEHMFKEEVFNGVRYIVSGGGGMLIQIPDKDGGFLHYIMVRVYGDYVDYEVRKICPPFWELLVYYIWKDAFYFLKDILF